MTVKVSGVATPNLNVTTTNENTAQSTTKTTVSDGKVIFNLGSTKDFSDGWNVGDVISVASIYTSFEQKFSFTIPAQGNSVDIKDASGVDVGTFEGGSGMPFGTLALVSVPSLPSLRYYTGQEFLDFYNLKSKDVDAENGISMVQLARIGQQVEQEIDNLTNSKFDNNSGSFYSPSAIEGGESPEYHDVRHFTQDDYFTKFIPINSVSTFEKNNNGPGQTPDWETLTEANNDIAIDKQTGRIKIIDQGELPEVGARHVRITYTFGRSTVSQDIKGLAIMMTGRRMVQSAFIKSRILKLDDTTTGDISEFTNFKNRIIKKAEMNKTITILRHQAHWLQALLRPGLYLASTAFLPRRVR